MPRRSGRESKPTPKGIKYRQEVEVKKTKLKTRRNVRLQKGELQALPIPTGLRVVEEENDFDMGKLADKFGTMKLGARRKSRKTRRARHSRR